MHAPFAKKTLPGASRLSFLRLETYARCIHLTFVAMVLINFILLIYRDFARANYKIVATIVVIISLNS